jgi:hypothetical protein
LLAPLGATGISGLQAGEDVKCGALDTPDGETIQPDADIMCKLSPVEAEAAGKRLAYFLPAQRPSALAHGGGEWHL